MKGFKMLTVKHNVNDVVTLKLVSGEEIIGYYTSYNSNKITLRKPVVPVPTEQGTMALAPYIMSSNYLHEHGGEIDFNINTVVTITKTNKSFSDAYSKQVSGLDLNTKLDSGLITA